MTGVDSDQIEMIERMKAGGHILMICHALAPGSGDPANFRIGDCATQRNLDKGGRKQARAIGDWLRSKSITSARVYSINENLVLWAMSEIIGSACNSFKE